MGIQHLKGGNPSAEPKTEGFLSSAEHLKPQGGKQVSHFLTGFSFTLCKRRFIVQRKQEEKYDLFFSDIELYKEINCKKLKSCEFVFEVSGFL